MGRSWLWLWLLAALALVACGGTAHSLSPATDAAAAPMEEMEHVGRPEMDPMAAYAQPGDATGGDLAEPPPPPQAPPAPSPAPASRPDVSGSSGDGAQTRTHPLLIYTAHYNLAVFEATAVIDAVQKLAEEQNGYLVRRGDRDITVRVPSGKFRDVLGAITKLGDVLHREETVEDVTERFFDLQVRLKNARALRDRLEALLVEAKDVKEALAVEQEMARVTQEIESLEGKLKLMRELIAYSTISVTLEPKATDKVDSNVRLPFPWLENLGLTNLMNL